MESSLSRQSRSRRLWLLWIPRGAFVALYGNDIAVSCRISCCVALVKVNRNKESTRGSIIKAQMWIRLLRYKSVDSYAAELSVMASRWMCLGKSLHKPYFRRINCLVSNSSHLHVSHSSNFLLPKSYLEIKVSGQRWLGKMGKEVTYHSSFLLCIHRLPHFLFFWCLDI